MKKDWFFVTIFLLTTFFCYKLFFEIQATRNGIGGEALLLFAPAVVALFQFKTQKNKERKDD